MLFENLNKRRTCEGIKQQKTAVFFDAVIPKAAGGLKAGYGVSVLDDFLSGGGV
jgi:hypothetical protein